MAELSVDCEERLPIPLSCPICLEQFATTLLLDEHLSQHIRRPYICACCERSFDDKSSLLEHFHSHSTLKLLSCGGILDIACEQAFASIPSLLTHILSEHKERMRELCMAKIICQRADIYTLICNWLRQPAAVRFRNAAVRACTATEFYAKDYSYIIRRWYKCTVCGHRFAKRQHLAKHKKDWHGKRMQKCDRCDEAFSAGPSYHEHARQHLTSEELASYYLRMGIRFDEEAVCRVCQASGANRERQLELLRDPEAQHAAYVALISDAALGLYSSPYEPCKNGTNCFSRAVTCYAVD